MDGSKEAALSSFVPGPQTTRAFRDALGRFGTGVTVVTAPGPVGITVNSFASVSLDPPLVLWSMASGSDRAAAFCDAPRSAIHVLAEAQAEMARDFARDGVAAFDRVAWSEDAHGVPLIEGCLARFECVTEACHPGGDHRILVSRVARASLGTGQPLLFVGGRFGAFAEPG